MHQSQTLNQRQEEYCAFAETLKFVPISWSYKKQTPFPHSSTEAGIMSWDAGLRMDGLPALSLWDTVIDVLEPSARGDPQQCPKQGKS